MMYIYYRNYAMNKWKLFNFNICYRIQSIKQMEKVLEDMPNEHKQAYFSAQIKILNISQRIKTQTHLPNNQINTYIGQQINIFYTLEKIFKETNLIHIFQLLKTIQSNYGSIVAIILQSNLKLTQQLQKVSKSEYIRKDSSVILQKTQRSMNLGHLQRPYKVNKLGGIMLYNENFSRYIEDSTILDQIRIQKQNRLNQIRRNLLRENIYDECLEKSPGDQEKTDEIARFINETRNKQTFFNHNSSESELQDILLFFENSQKEANNFLVKKMRTFNEQDKCFSFANIQRDVMYFNSKMKINLVIKLRELMLKYTTKQQQFQDYRIQKEKEIQAINSKSIKLSKSSQTELDINQLLKNNNQQIKRLQQECKTSKLIYLQEALPSQDEHKLRMEIQVKQYQIDKLYHRIIQLEQFVSHIKKEIKEKKKPSNTLSTNDLALKTKKKQIENIDQNQLESKSKINEKGTQQSQQMSKIGTNQWLLTQSKWRNSKISNYTSPFMSNNNIFGQNMENWQQKKKAIKYNMKQRMMSTQKQQTSSKNLKDYINFQVKKQNKYRQVQVQTEQFTLGSSHLKSIKFIDISLDQIHQNSGQVKYNPSNRKSSSKKKQKDNQKNHNSSKSSHLKSSIESQQSLKSTPSKSKNVTTHLRTSRIKQNTLQLNKSTTSISQNQDNMLKQKQQSKFSTKNEKLKSISDELQEGQKQNKSILKKVTNSSYKIFEVLQDEKQYQTKNNIENSERHCPSNSNQIKSLQSQLQLKSNKLGKSKEDNYILQKVYSLVIYPCLAVKNSGIQSILNHQKIVNKESQIFNRCQEKLQKTFYNIKISIKSSIQSDCQTQDKKQKIQQWQASLLDHLQQKYITERQVNAIITMLNSISNEEAHKDPSKYQLYTQPIQTNHSLNDLQKTIYSKALKRSHMKYSQILLSHNQLEKKMSSVNSTYNLKNELSQRLHFQLYHQKISKYITKVHQNCKEGPLCSHIFKYFENLMKYFDQKRKLNKKKQLCLHIENIGENKNFEGNEQIMLQLLKQENKKKKKNRHSSDDQIHQKPQDISKLKSKRKNNSNLALPLIGVSKKIARGSMRHLKGIKQIQK